MHGPAPDPVTALIAELNAEYFVVNEGGHVVIYRPRHDREMKRRVLDRMTFADFVRFLRNRTITVAGKKGQPMKVKVADVWLDHEDRRQYPNGITFDPTTTEHSGGCFNLWQGFAVEPRSGSWDLLKNHLRTTLCGGNAEYYRYLLDWTADMIQHPAKQAEVAVVLCGPEGCGKGVFARALVRLFGQHGRHIYTAKHLTGNFNSHQRDCVCLFADEALFAGDKAHVGVLKALVTEPTLTIEAKYQNAIQTPNYLHLILASNEHWVVPAGLQSRRWFVLDAKSDQIGDHTYFNALYAELENGGLAAMLDHLLHRNLANANLRAVPTTAALLDQRTRSLDTIHAWWLDCLYRGHVYDSTLGLEDTFAQWHDFIATTLLYASYEKFCREHHERRPLTRERLGAWFTNTIGAKASRRRNQPIGEHMTDAQTTNLFSGITHHGRVAEVIIGFPCGYELGSLDEARTQFCKITGLNPVWPTGP
jgi:hypothetical protein